MGHRFNESFCGLLGIEDCLQEGIPVTPVQSNTLLLANHLVSLADRSGDYKIRNGGPAEFRGSLDLLFRQGIQTQMNTFFL